MRVRVLGTVGIFVDDVEVLVPAGKPLALLAMLALAGGSPVSTEDLTAGLWGEDAPLTAARTLQVHVSTLRSRLRNVDIAVELSSAGYRLDVDPDDVDVVCFERLAAQGLGSLVDHCPDVASRTLQRALELWTGDPLSNVLDAPFAAHEADRLALRRLGVIQGKADADLALGLGATLVDELREVLDANPYNERACGQLMVALYRAGQPVAALEVYRHLRRTLGEELGMEPGPELVELERQILVHDDRLLVEPVDAGKSHNLPQQLSSFVGRQREVDELRNVMSEARLATLTGSGGAGKTRLALAVADSLTAEYSAGVWLVELASLTDPDLVATTTAQTLGVRHDNGLDGLADGIADRSLLVVLDNCEHLIDAASTLAEGLLRRCPNLRILATSREPLAIGGEHVYRIPPLGLAPGDVTEADVAVRSDAVRLFVDRAQLHRADFTLGDANAADVAQICRRLDGMPLAIELAAARIRTLSVKELSRRLDERFRLLTGSNRSTLARQHTLRALIDWSYELLSGAERLMLERLSVFAGGFTMEATEAICSTEPDVDVLELVTALVDKSLVEVDYNESGRLRMLETIREYAAERLAARSPSTIEATRLGHARYYLAMAEEAAPALEQGPGQREWLDRLTVEHENLRAAADTFVDLPEGAEDGLRLVNNLRLFWDSRGLFSEGATTTARFLELPTASEASENFVLALCTASDMLERRGDRGPAEQLAADAARLAHALGQRHIELKAALCQSWLLARRGELQLALDMLEPYTTRDPQSPDPQDADHARGCVLLYLNDLGASRVALELAESAVRLAKNERRLAAVLMDLSCLDVAEHDLQAAMRHLQEAQILAARLRDVSMLVFVSLNLGLLAIMGGDYEQARVRYREALLLSWPGGELLTMQTAVLGIALCCGGDHVEASTLHGFLDAAEQGQALGFDPTEGRLRQDDRIRRRDALGYVEFDKAVQRGRRMSLTEAVALAKDAATRCRAEVQLLPTGGV